MQKVRNRQGNKNKSPQVKEKIVSAQSSDRVKLIIEAVTSQSCNDVFHSYDLQPPYNLNQQPDQATYLKIKELNQAQVNQQNNEVAQKVATNQQKEEDKQKLFQLSLKYDKCFQIFSNQIQLENNQKKECSKQQNQKLQSVQNRNSEGSLQQTKNNQDKIVKQVQDSDSQQKDEIFKERNNEDTETQNQQQNFSITPEQDQSFLPQKHYLERDEDNFSEQLNISYEQIHQCKICQKSFNVIDFLQHQKKHIKEQQKDIDKQLNQLKEENKRKISYHENEDSIAKTIEKQAGIQAIQKKEQKVNFTQKSQKYLSKGTFPQVIYSKQLPSKNINNKQIDYQQYRKYFNEINQQGRFQRRNIDPFQSQQSHQPYYQIQGQKMQGAQSFDPQSSRGIDQFANFQGNQLIKCPECLNQFLNINDFQRHYFAHMFAQQNGISEIDHDQSEEILQSQFIKDKLFEEWKKYQYYLKNMQPLRLGQKVIQEQHNLS